MGVPYLLDTNVCIHLINRRAGYARMLARIGECKYGEVLISSITAAELEFGIAKSARGTENRMRVDLFLARFEFVPFGMDAAGAYGPLRAGLESGGIPIGPLDTLIAAHALALHATLVTNNVREFRRVPGLAVEDWLDEEERRR